MAQVVDFFINNNYSLFAKNFIQHNSIIDQYGVLVIAYSPYWNLLYTKRIEIGSNVVTEYNDLLWATSSRDTNGTPLVGTNLTLLNLPKWDNPRYACLAGQSNYDNAWIFFGELDGNNITWTRPTDPEFLNDDEAYLKIIQASSNNHYIFGAYVNSVDKALDMGRMNAATSGKLVPVSETTYDYYPIMAMHTDPDGECIVASATFDGTTGDPYNVVFAAFSSVDSSWGTPVQLYTANLTGSDFIENVDIAYDYDEGAIGILVSWWDDSELELVIDLFISTDGGTSFDKTTVTKPGTGDYEGVTGDMESHIAILSGVEGGFITGMTALNDDGVARPYVQTWRYEYISSGYVVDTAHKECGTATGKYDATSPIIGPMFFRAPASSQVNIEPIELVYIAYQLGDGLVPLANYPQDSPRAVALGFERLDEVAFSTFAGTWTVDTAGSGEYVVPINLIGDHNSRIDYYTEGFTGEYTDKYMGAWSQYGTPVRVKSYAPRNDVYIGGRTAYEDPEEYTVKVFFDPASWGSPNAELGSTDFDDYIERDLRKIYFDASFYMPVVRNYSKTDTKQYTVWILEHDGYSYEIRQTIPRFLGDQIIYWEANCYNIGNYDVWSRGGGY